MRRFIALSLLVLCPLSGAEAAKPAAPLTEQIEVAFAPGDLPIHYAFELADEQRQNGEFESHVVRGLDEIGFVKASDGSGYDVSWKTLNFRVQAAEPLSTLLEASYKALADVPLTYRASASGAPEGITDLEKTRQASKLGLTVARNAMLAARHGDGTPLTDSERLKIATMFEAILAPFAKADDAALSTQLLETARMIFGFGGAKLTLWGRVPFEYREELPWGVAIPLRGVVETSYIDRQRGRITVVRTAATDPADVKASIATYLDTLAGKLPAELVSAQREASRTFEDFTVTERTELVIDYATGIPDSMTFAKTVDGNGRHRVERRSYRRQTP